MVTPTVTTGTMNIQPVAMSAKIKQGGPNARILSFAYQTPGFATISRIALTYPTSSAATEIVTMRTCSCARTEPCVFQQGLPATASTTARTGLMNLLSYVKTLHKMERSGKNDLLF